MPTALITGISGQDGSFLADLLLEKGYEVHGMVMRVELEDPAHRLINISNIIDKVHLHVASLDSYASVFNVVEQVCPDECYHLAAQSFVGSSFVDEFTTINTNINGTHFILAALKERAPDCRFYFASSSEMFGSVEVSPQNEDTPFHPRSPYGISKVAGFHLTQNYREAYNLFACSGICYNHESERRGYEFVTRKITSAVARIKYGQQKELKLGNLDARRDWGYARDYVKAFWLMLQQPQPDDFVIATGQTHSVSDFIQKAFEIAGLNWEEYVKVDQQLIRAPETNLLQGDASRARAKLGWSTSVPFEQLVYLMVEADLKRIHDQ